MPAPEKLIIDTPEQIALEFPLAAAGSRFLALLIDTLIQIAGLFLLGAIALGAALLRRRGYAGTATWIIAALVMAAFLLYYGYFAAFEALWSGQTPGKRVLGIRVIRVSGQPITPFDAILRNLLRIVDQLPGIYAVGLLSMFFTARSQRLGDLAAGTVVVLERAASVSNAPAIDTPAARLGAARLTAQELEVIETFLARRDALPEYTRMKTAQQLAAHIRTRLQISRGAQGSPVGSDTDEALIESVAAEFRRR